MRGQSHQRDNGIEAVRKIDYDRRIEGGRWIMALSDFLHSMLPTTDWLYAFIDGDRIPTPPNWYLATCDIATASLMPMIVAVD